MRRPSLQAQRARRPTRQLTMTRSRKSQRAKARRTHTYAVVSGDARCFRCACGAWLGPANIRYPRSKLNRTAAGHSSCAAMAWVAGCGATGLNSWRMCVALVGMRAASCSCGKVQRLPSGASRVCRLRQMVNCGKAQASLQLKNAGTVVQARLLQEDLKPPNK